MAGGSPRKVTTAKQNSKSQQVTSTTSPQGLVLVELHGCRAITDAFQVSGFDIRRFNIASSEQHERKKKHTYIKTSSKALS